MRVATQQATRHPREIEIDVGRMFIAARRLVEEITSGCKPGPKASRQLRGGITVAPIVGSANDSLRRRVRVRLDVRDS
jgi:hypothetical protein